jgi:hypothetical protein
VLGLSSAACRVVLDPLDWHTGQIDAQLKLPATGDVVAGLYGMLRQGFYLTLGTGKYNFDSVTWERTALLLVTSS